MYVAVQYYTIGSSMEKKKNEVVFVIKPKKSVMRRRCASYP